MALVYALIAACCYGTGAVLQSRVAAVAPADLSLSPKMLVYLAKQRVWLAGIAAMVAGMVCQAAALDVGSLAVVEPLLVVSLLFALPIGARLARQRLNRREWLAALATAAGLAGILAIGAPTAGRPDASTHNWLIIGPMCAAVTLALVVVSRHKAARAADRATILGIGGGILLGLQDAMTKSGFAGLSISFHHLLVSWQPYGLIATAIYALVLVQSAYKAAPLAASFPAIMITQPLTGVLIGVTCFGEHIRVGALPLAGAVVSAVVMILGAHSLARSPLVCQPVGRVPRDGVGEPPADSPCAPTSVVTDDAASAVVPAERTAPEQATLPDQPAGPTQDPTRQQSTGGTTTVGVG